MATDHWHVPSSVSEVDGATGRTEQVCLDASVAAGTVVLSVAKDAARVSDLPAWDTLQVGEHEHLRFGSKALKLNHARAGNLRVVVEADGVRFVAAAAIAAGEALSFDYNLTEWSMREAFDDWATGERVRGFKYLPAAARSRLLAEGAVAPHVASRAAREASVDGAIAIACNVILNATDECGDGDQSAMLGSGAEYAALESLWNEGGDFFSTTASPLSPFVMAVAMGRLATVEATLRRADDTMKLVLVSRRESNLRRAPIHAVVAGARMTRASGDFRGLCALLLEAGADADARDVLGRTPVHGLVRNLEDDGVAAAIDLLEVLAAEADLDAPDRAGMVPLFGPCREGRPEVVAKLLALGADPHRPFTFFKDTMGASLSKIAGVLKFDERVVSMLKVGGESPTALAAAETPPAPAQACAGCNKSASVAKLSLCSRCKKVAYCSAACQRADWRFHKRVCAKRG